REDGRIVRVTDLPDIEPERDLTLRAANALRAECGAKRGVSIELTKRLPLGGGLGGGTSDAATTLLALNYLWQCGFSHAELARIGLALGADVPVFIHGHSAFGEGVGERLTDVHPPPAWYLVLTPPVVVSTAEIFRADDLRRDSSAIAPENW